MAGPLILIILGVLFLLNNLYPGRFQFGKMWPIILIAIGIGKIMESLARRKGAEPPQPPAGKETQ